MKKMILVVFILALFSSVVYGQIEIDSISRTQLNYINNFFSGRPPYMRIKIPDCPKDGLAYELVFGETIAYYSPANGWSIDSIEKGKVTIYKFYAPFVNWEAYCFTKKKGNIFYRYENGKKYTGKIYEEINEGVMEADVVNGVIQTASIWTRTYPRRLVAQANFNNGELIGECSCWNLKTGEKTKIIFIKGEEEKDFNVFNKDK